ncbi:Uncharacterized protein APZ42_001622 [Daphnia magna]|uniref:Uncharacterized protein n=1 Tax=Daphnia magna TaxID=35525 RepID=A0A162D059_9CRUS|nr:Uncharacterized protein APZ42_001622 [Daphnia magna]
MFSKFKMCPFHCQIVREQRGRWAFFVSIILVLPSVTGECHVIIGLLVVQHGRIASQYQLNIKLFSLKID